MKRAPDHSRWHATLAILAAMLLYALLPARFTIGPVWVGPALVLIVLVPLIVMRARQSRSMLQRAASIVLIAIVNFFNAVSVVLLVHTLVTQAHQQTGAELLLSGSQIWLTNVLVFSLWFWELDGDGPVPRSLAACAKDVSNADFLFPQMSADPARNPWVPTDWKPQFVDYLYLAFTNATAFSPTDVMPLTPMAKMLMLVESLISLVTLALILARSVNIIT
ncbi:MAG TPA: hypothetical protein VIN40_05300 [Candidatus Tyrphobacter sp.]